MELAASLHVAKFCGSTYTGCHMILGTMMS